MSAKENKYKPEWGPDIPEDYALVAIKRTWIPEFVYSLFNIAFGNRLGTIQPFRWILHREVKL